MLTCSFFLFWWCGTFSRLLLLLALTLFGCCWWRHVGSLGLIVCGTLDGCPFHLKEGPHCVLYPITTYLPALETHHRHHSYKFIPYSLNCKRKSIHQLNYHHHHHHVSTCKLLPISSSKRCRSWNCLWTRILLHRLRTSIRSNMAKGNERR